MGAYTPLPWAPDDLVEEVRRRVLEPTVVEMARRGAPFAGLLYAGLALTKRGLRVVEFNARFGDPETQALLQRLDSPLGVLLQAAAEGRLHEVDPPTLARRSGRHRRGGRRRLPREPAQGRRRSPASTRPTRSRASTSSTPAPPPPATTWSPPAAGSWPSPPSATSVADARARAYEGVDLIEIDGAHHRTDIAAGV